MNNINHRSHVIDFKFNIEPVFIFIHYFQLLKPTLMFPNATNIEKGGEKILMCRNEHDLS